MLDTSARLLRLLSTLQSRRSWSGSELADELEITPRTLRRDIERLRALGYAVEATSGHGGGYRLGTGTAMPPLLLDDEEAVAVGVALRSASDAFAGLGETALRVLVKLEQLLPARLRSRLGAVQAMTVSVHELPWAVDPERLGTLAAACRDHGQLEFAYVSRDGRTSTRHVEPLRLAHAAGRRWYLLAFDRDRDDWRTFRVDRIEGTVSVGSRFVPRQPPADPARFVAEALYNAPFQHRASIKLRGSIDQLAAQVPAWCGTLEPLDGESCILRTGAESIEGLVCQMLLCSVDFELLEPAELAPKIRAIAERLERSVAPSAARVTG